MDEIQKKIISFALNYDILSLNTYSGYKGGLILKITTNHVSVVDKIEKYAFSLPVEEVVVKHNILRQFEIYCITPDDVYSLKYPKSKA